MRYNNLFHTWFLFSFSFFFKIPLPHLPQTHTMAGFVMKLVLGENLSLSKGLIFAPGALVAFPCFCPCLWLTVVFWIRVREPVMYWEHEVG